MNHHLDIDRIRQEFGSFDKTRMDGKKVAKLVRKDVKRQVDFLTDKGIKPCLAVVLVGDDPASQTYVKWKVRACDEVGIRSIKRVMPKDTSQKELNDYLDSLNQDPEVDGILLQLPLPKGLDAVQATDHMDYKKDVDGFHPLNLGLLVAGKAYMKACTPYGIMILLDVYGVDLKGTVACVVGRSIMVGRPMAQLLMQANATVTMCHSHTQNLEEVVRRSDLVVVATGMPELVKGEWIKPGAVVIDVGQTHQDGKILGDVDYQGALEHAKYITPVPGGVGPMTVAALMVNTVSAAWHRYESRDSKES